MMLRKCIEAFCANGAVCFPGPAGKLRLSRGFRVYLPEVRAATNRVRNQVSACFGLALSALHEKSRCQLQWRHTSSELFDPIRTYAGSTPSDAPVSVERYRNRKAFQCLQATREGKLGHELLTLWLGHELPSAKPGAKDRKDLDLYFAGVLGDESVQTAKLASPIEAALAPLGATLEPLDSQAVVTEWHRTLAPSTASRRLNIAAPQEPAFSLTDLCWLSELRGLGDRGFYLDGEYHALRTLSRLPTFTYPGIMDHLTTLSLPDFTITVLLERLAKAPLVEHLQGRLRRIQHQLERHSDPLLQVSRTQIEEKLAQLARDVIVPMGIEVILILHAPTLEELSRRDDLLKNATSRMNGALLFEASLAASARNLFLKTLPGWLWSSDPGFVLYGESDYIRDLLPASSSFEAHLNEAEALFMGQHQNLVGVRTFVGEGDALTPQHCVVGGASGTGKSFFLCRLLIETAAFYSYTAILEEGFSYRPFVEALGATSLSVTPDAPLTFNSFRTEGLPDSSFHRSLNTALVCQMIGLSRDEDKALDCQALVAKHIAELCSEFADDWLRRQPEDARMRLARHALALHRLAGERMCELSEAFIALRDELKSDPKAAQRRLDAASDAEVRSFATKHRDALRELSFAYLREFPTLSGLREHMEVAGLQDEGSRKLADRLRRWCVGGSHGRLFDGQNDVSLTGANIHVELSKISDAAKELKATLWFLFLIIFRQHLLSLPARLRKRMIIEEVSRLLSVPGGEALLRELYSQFRKYNVQCVMVYQQLAQLDSEALRSVVLGNVRMAFIFHPGDPKDLDRLSEHLPVSEAAKAMILRYARPDQLRGTVYSECCYLHLTSREPFIGTIRFIPIND